MVVLTSVETLSSPSPIIAAFARTAGANVLASDVDDEKLDDNEDVGEGEEKIEDENHDYDDQLVNKRKRKLQQVVSITSRLTETHLLSESKRGETCDTNTRNRVITSYACA